MAGHGSLCRPSVALRQVAVVGLFCALALQHASAEDAGEIDARLRLQWRASEACHWKAQVQLVSPNPETASIDEIIDCGESKLAGSIDFSHAPARLLIQPRFPVTGGTVGFHVQGHRDTKLLVRIYRFQAGRTAALEELPTRELTLAQLIEAGELHSQDQQAERPSWTLSRVDGDAIRLEGLPVDRVVAPEQEVTYTARCNSMLAHASQQLTLHASLISVNDGTTIRASRHLLKIDSNGNSPPAAITFQAPSTAGVYEIRSLVVKEDDNVWSRFRRRDVPLMQTGQPIFVLAPEPAKVEPAKVEPAKVEPAKVEPAKVEPAKVESAPGARVAVESVPAEPVTAETVAAASAVDRGEIRSTAWQNVGEIRPSSGSWSVGALIPPSTSRLIPGSEPETPELPQELYADKTVWRIEANQSFETPLPTLRPSIPHRITLRMAQNRAIRLRVQLGSSSDSSSTFLITQDAIVDQSRPWLQHTWVHYPQANQQITLTNLSGAEAAIESISVEAGPSDLNESLSVSALDPISERRLAVLRVSGGDWIDRWSQQMPLGRSDFDQSTLFAQRVWVSSNRVAEYAIAMRMNGVMLPTDENTPVNQVTASRDPVELALRCLQHCSLRVFVSLRPSSLLDEPERLLRADPGRVGELTRDEINRSAQYNLLNPLIQKNLATRIADLDARFSSHANYAGLALICDRGSHLQPPLRADQDESTVAMFAEAKGLPASSLEQRRVWLADEGKVPFQEWIQQRTRQAYDVITSALLDRPALMLVASRESLGLRATPESTWTVSPIIAYGDDEVLSERRWLQTEFSNLSVSNGESFRAVAVESQPRKEFHRVRPTAYADLSRIMDHLSPNILVVDESTTAGQLNEGTRDFFAALTSLPAIAMQGVDSPDPASQTVHVRAAQHQGQLYVAIVSHVPWPTDVDLETSAPARWETHNRSSLQLRGEGRLRMLVPPGQMVVLHSSPQQNANLWLTGWAVRVSGGIETLQQIKQQVTMIVERIGALSEFGPSEQPRNGGFEQSGKMGLVGWLHAQHPPGCVRIDDQYRAGGNQSVKLTTDSKSAGRTWIVSDTIDPPASGRLAVSLTCRAERNENSTPHQLKVSIEATRNGRPVRYATEFEVPRNGQWNPLDAVLEVDGVDRGEVDSLRLTIDSLSSGQVWVDDVRLHEHFATQREREELQSLAFLAVQGLQRGNLAPSGRLLQNYWARHLLTLRDLDKTKPTDALEPISPEPAGVAERLKSWLPRPLRF